MGKDVTYSSQHIGQHTSVLQDKSIAAERGITAEGQEERVGAALNALRDVHAVKAAQQRAERIRPIVDMQEVVARF